MTNSKWQLIGHCGVDSGQIILVDPCYVLANEPVEKDPQMTYQELLNERGILEATTKNPMPQSQEIIFSKPGGNGVVVDSGLGDGNYPVYAKIEKIGDWGTRVTEVKIKFIEDEY